MKLKVYAGISEYPSRDILEEINARVMAEFHDSVTIHINSMADKETIYRACLIDIKSLVTDLTHSSLSLFLWWIDSYRILGVIWLCSLGSDPWLDWWFILGSLSSLGSCPCQSIPAAPLQKVSWLSITCILRYVVTMAINIRRHSFIPRLTDRLTAHTIPSCFTISVEERVPFAGDNSFSLSISAQNKW